ncbi:MAG: zinc-ribbon domain containing protein, partial [Comamonadaceae bacterium]|nr:zinc-ribbon domain containing protein [Comamonadaceae bacterium]
MKSSNKQRRAQLQQQRLACAQDWPTRLAQAANAQEARALIAQAARQGVGVALADQAVLARHNSATFLPGCYIDQPFTCCRCGAQEVWTAKQQKWWYEVAHGPIYSGAKHCRACRAARRQQRAQTQAASALDQQMAQLRALGQQRFAPHLLQAGPWPDALRSKWWGVRVAAIQTLGQWWGASRAGEALAVRDGFGPINHQGALRARARRWPPCGNWPK